jgi:phosphate starvation-inducible PhoH-like protein
VLQRLFGTLDENIKEVVAAFDVQVVLLSGVQHLQGDENNVNLALKVLDKLTSIVLSGDDLDTGRVRYICQAAKSGLLEEVDTLLGDVVTVTAKGKPVKSKTVGQKKYVDAIKNNIITFGIGPAGTGKTYLAVALAVASYKAKRVEKIILTRPAVEAGEKLGFLPGDLAEKVNPYLRPLYDALSEMFGHETYTKLIEKGAIEIAPLAYMRGRTLSNAFIILDEAQNTTKEQIKMFLTRLGENSKMVLTGDLTQVDLPTGKVSGLRYASKILAAVKDIGVIKFSEKDVVRHPLVQLIVKAYEEAEDKSREDKKRK